MRRILTVLGTVVVLTTAPLGAYAQDPAPSGELFVQTARGGSLSTDDEGQLTLTLKDIDGRVVYFSDRPARRAGTLPTDAMILAAFSAKEDPNAALLIEESGSSVIVPLELSQPTIEDGAITYLAYVLEAVPESFATYELLENHSQIEFGEAALFIDSGSTTYQILQSARLRVTPTSAPAIVKNVGLVELFVEGGGPGPIVVEPGLSISVAVAPDGSLTVINRGPGDGLFILE